jgi:hypothetical protein
MTDYDDLINTIYPGSFLNILKVIRDRKDTKNGPKAVARCLLCNRNTIARLRDIQTGHTGACKKCLRSKIFKKNCEEAVARMPAEQIAEIWDLGYSKHNRMQLSKQFRCAAAHIDFAKRQHQRGLDEIAAGEKGIAIYREVRMTGNAKRVATRHGLSLNALRYIDSEIRSKLREVGYKVQYARFMMDQVRNRDTSWGSGNRKNEFTRQELRIEKGVVKGEASEVYELRNSRYLDLLNQDERKILNEFFAIAKYTLKNRTDRRKTGAREAIKRKKEKRDWERRKRDRESAASTAIDGNPER